MKLKTIETRIRNGDHYKIVSESMYERFWVFKNDQVQGWAFELVYARKHTQGIEQPDWDFNTNTELWPHILKFVD